VNRRGVSVPEVREVVRACAHIRVPDPAPVYLQQFLVLRLVAEHSSLAAKVYHLSPAQSRDLFRLVRKLQDAANYA
jgi:hypothetical protein